MIARHLLGYLPVQACQALVGFAGVAVFTRLMSAESYGVLSLMLAGLSLAHIVSFTWLQAALARFHARAEARGRLRDHLATAYALYFAMAGAIAVGVVLTLVLVPMDRPIQNALVFAAALFLLRGLMQMGLESHKAAGRIARYSVLQSGYLTAGFMLGAGLLIATDWGAAGVLAGGATAAAVAVVFDLPVMLRGAKGGARQPVRARIYARYGGAVSASLVFESLLSVGDRFLIAALMGSGAVGAYAAGYGLGERLLNIVFIWFAMAVWPMTVRALERDGAGAARGLAGRAAALMALVSFPTAAGLALVAEPLAGLMLGESVRRPAADIMPWVAAAGLLNGIMTHYFHEAFTLTRRSGVMAALMAGAAAFNLLLNLMLIPRFGLPGAAASTLIAYAAALVVCALIGRRYFALPLPWRDWTKAAGATALMAAAVLALPGAGADWLDLLIRALTGALVYAAAALMLNIADCRAWLRGAGHLAKRPAASG